MTKKIKKKTSLEALDELIVQAQEEAAKILETHGSDSPEYNAAVCNLTKLAEQRAAIAETQPQRKKVDPNTLIAGGLTLAGSLGSTLLLLVYDEDHVVPKWFKTAAVGIKDFLKSKD